MCLSISPSTQDSNLMPLISCCCSSAAAAVAAAVRELLLQARNPKSSGSKRPAARASCNSKSAATERGPPGGPPLASAPWRSSRSTNWGAPAAIAASRGDGSLPSKVSPHGEPPLLLLLLPPVLLQQLLLLLRWFASAPKARSFVAARRSPSLQACTHEHRGGQGAGAVGLLLLLAGITPGDKEIEGAAPGDSGRERMREREGKRDGTAETAEKETLKPQ